MTEPFKKGDILVSLKKQKSSDREAPVEIREGYIGENASPSEDEYVFFTDTPPARGGYKAKNFRIATEDERNQFIKGRKIAEPECPFDEGDLLVCIKDTSSIEGDKGVLVDFKDRIDGMVKTKDSSKSIMWFEKMGGTYRPSNEYFRKASMQEELDYGKI